MTRRESFRLMRVNAGLSKNLLARRMGVSKYTIQAWEAGKHPLPEWAVRLATVCCSQKGWQYLQRLGFSDAIKKGPHPLDVSGLFS